VSHGTSSGAVCGALRRSILRPSGHITTIPRAGRLWGSLLQGHPAQGPPVISAVCCWGRIDHRNNIADILEHRSSCDSSGIGSPLAEADPNPTARSSDPTPIFSSLKPPPRKYQYRTAPPLPRHRPKEHHARCSDQNRYSSTQLRPPPHKIPVSDRTTTSTTSPRCDYFEPI